MKEYDDLFRETIGFPPKRTHDHSIHLVTYLRSLQEWPRPKYLRDLKGFLGLINYYQRFMRQYGRIVELLIRLLNKNAFIWDEGTIRALKAFKLAFHQY